MKLPESIIKKDLQNAKKSIENFFSSMEFIDLLIIILVSISIIIFVSLINYLDYSQRESFDEGIHAGQSSVSSQICKEFGFKTGYYDYPDIICQNNLHQKILLNIREVIS